MTQKLNSLKVLRTLIFESKNCSANNNALSGAARPTLSERGKLTVRSYCRNFVIYKVVRWQSIL